MPTRLQAGELGGVVRSLWVRTWVLGVALIISGLGLFLFSTGQMELLITVPCIAVLGACGYRCAKMPWLWRDRRYVDPAPELFGAGRVEATMPAASRLSGIDLRDITTPSWSIDFAT